MHLTFMVSIAIIIRGAIIAMLRLFLMFAVMIAEHRYA
jgi:hypothetical protein